MTDQKRAQVQREPDTRPEPIFHTWTSDGRRFLAVRGGSGWLVVDEDGGNYGVWWELATVRRHQRDGTFPPLSRVRAVLSVQGVAVWRWTHDRDH